MNWLNTFKGSLYTLFFIALNLIYLVIELSFNARILEVSAAFSPATDFSQLELYGRSISASGATLFAWRLLVPSWSSISLFNIILKFLLIAVIVFPVVFIGQKTLVDNLVDKSSNETRRTAEILSLLKFGIANGFVEIDELAIDEVVLQTAEGKMFITLSGLLAFNSNNMREVLDRELEKIAGYAIATQQTETSEQLYKSYLYVSNQIMDQYTDYHKLVETLEHQQSLSLGEAISLYQKAMNEALLPWLDYLRLNKESSGIDDISSSQISTMQYLLMTAQQRVNNCTHLDCFDDAVQQLQLRLGQQLGFYSPVSDWCQRYENDGIKLRCLKDTQDVHDNIYKLRRLTLAVNAGLTSVYDSKLQYLNSIDFRSSVFSYLSQQGITIDAAWRFDQYEMILQDVSAQLDAKYLAEYSKSVLQQYDTDIKPRIELTEFNQIHKMQNYFAQALGELYDQEVDLNLTLEQFENSHIAPVYFSKFKALLNKLKADESWYHMDAPYEESGKSSLRNLVVPAVAIAFSLIFGLLNFINLILNLLFLLIQEKFWIRWAGFIALVTFILMMPVRHEYQIYSQPAYVDLLSETQKDYGLWADALDWVARTEPLVYPIGNILRHNLLDGFGFD
ncbi:MAG: hypothetical protein GY744_03000 [Gammaproteobacteria bacterium]|nr:hypothetical protein [Gammaproteobacteria bacterium]